MFIGSISRDSRSVIENILDGVDKTSVKDVYVGCSGNFTFDRVAGAKGFRVHSNDVSLYSALIASIVRGEEFPCVCVNEELIPIFDEWPDSRYKPLIEVMFAMRYGSFEPRKNDYQKVFADNYVRCSREFYDGTVQKFERDKILDFPLEEFYFGDFKEHLSRCGDNCVIFLYAPTYKGGYEKIFRFVEDSFDYERPKYELFDPKTAGEYYRALLSNRQACIYSDIRYPETADFFKGEIVKTGKRPVFIHSSVAGCKSYYVETAETLLKSTPIILSETDEITDETKIEIVPVKTAVVNHYKYMFMSAKVNYSLGGDFALAFTADGKIFGFAVFSKGLGTSDSQKILFLHSDFVVNSCVERLSKLLLYLLRSKETARQIARFYVHRYLGLQTSVYTDKPVSMKYRGPWKKLDRKDTGKLTYTAMFTDHSIKECYALWKHRKPMD